MDVLKKISDCIVNMDEDNIGKFIKEAIDSGIKVDEIFKHGLNDGMAKAISVYDNGSYDIPELIVCADTLSKGVKILGTYGSIKNDKRGKIVLSVVEGDTHEIGKNIVYIMLEAAGYDVIDLGVNRSNDDIINTAIEEGADIIGLSSMMTTTRGEMKKLIDKINSMSLNNRPLVIIGGGSITEKYASSINADGYSSNAPNAVKLVEKLLKGEGI